MLGDARRVEVDGGPPVLGLHAPACAHLVEDRLLTASRGPSESVNSSPAALRGRRRTPASSRESRPLHGGQAPPFGWYCRASRSRASAPSPSGDAGHLAGRARVVRRQLPALLRLAVAAAAGGEDDGRRLDHVVAAPGPPAVRRLLELGERRFRQRRRARGLDGVAQRRGDRVPGPVADLEQALPRRAAAAGQPVAAVLAREGDAELLEPVDRVRRLAGEDLDEPAVRRLVGARRPPRAAPASRPRRTRPGCRPAPSPSCTTAASPSSRPRRGRRRAGRSPRRRGRTPAADHEHVERRHGGHDVGKLPAFANSTIRPRYRAHSIDRRRGASVSTS